MGHLENNELGFKGNSGESGASSEALESVGLSVIVRSKLDRDVKSIDRLEPIVSSSVTRGRLVM